MGNKIYVGNILYEITDDELRQLFSQFGQVVSAEVVRYKKSKRSKGFAYVRMANPDEAQQAIAALNGQDYRGRKLFLELAKSDDPPPEVMAELRQNAEAGTVVENSQEAFEAQQAQEQQAEQQAMEAQQEYSQQQNYTEMPQQQVETIPTQPEPQQQDQVNQPINQPSTDVQVPQIQPQSQQTQEQNYTPHAQHIGRSGTIFSGNGDRTNNS